jgi:transaldolase
MGSDVMKFFVDSAELPEIQKLNAMGLVDGVTTNPSLIYKSGRDFLEVIRDIAAVVPGPISAEVTAEDHPTMMREAEKLVTLGKNIVIKVPLTVDGLMTCRRLRQDHIPVNVTLCFSLNQALLAAKAGASYISPFVGRLDDQGQDGMGLIQDIRDMYDTYGFETEILAASIRHTDHVRRASLIGADVVTCPPSIFYQLFTHSLTEKGLTAFREDWAKTGQRVV